MIRAEVRIIDDERPNYKEDIHLIEPTEIEENAIETVYRFKFNYCVLDRDFDIRR